MYLQKITLQGVASYLSNSKSTLMAGNMNMVLLIGRLGADPQIFTFEDGGLAEGITAKFGLKAVPSVITQQGNRLLISEVPVGDRGAGPEDES